MTDLVTWLECVNLFAIAINLSSFVYVLRSIYLMRQQRWRIENCLRVLEMGRATGHDETRPKE